MIILFQLYRIEARNLKTRKEAAMSGAVGANSTFVRKVDSIGWAIFFVWIGAAMLAGMGWTWSSIGTALIIFGVQAALLFKGERIDIFMLSVGLVLLVGAVMDMLGSHLTLIPGLLIVIGTAMLANALRSGSGKSDSQVQQQLD
jgi:hypothetical protein